MEEDFQIDEWGLVEADMTSTRLTSLCDAARGH